jgi:hypothetical protein
MNRVNFQQVDELKSLLQTIERCRHELPISIQQSFTGYEGLRRLVAAMTILLIETGGTTPEGTCSAIAELAPDLYKTFSPEQVLAACDEIQHSEIAEQSALFQDIFDRFNDRYFAGSLTGYKVLVVYDLWHWETEHAYAPSGRPLEDGWGYVDFPERRIFIRFVADATTMIETLTHEMAHAATNGEHGDAWQTEMARLKQLGAPVSDSDVDTAAE